MTFKHCAVNTCFVRSNGATTKTFYGVSAKNRSFEAWKKFCANDSMTIHSHVCDKHFTDQDFVNKNNHSQGLVPFAVPSIREPVDNSPALTPDESQRKLLIPKQELCDGQYIVGEITVPQSEPIKSISSTQGLLMNCKTTIVKKQKMEDPLNIGTFIITELPDEHTMAIAQTVVSPITRRRQTTPAAEVVHHHHDYLASPGLNSNMRMLVHELAKVREQNILLKKKLRKMSQNLSRKNILIRKLRAEVKRPKEEVEDDSD